MEPGDGNNPAPPDADEDALLRAFLHGRSHPCPVCAYDLRDLPTDRCPECGRRLRLTLTEREPVYTPFIVGLIAWASATGSSAAGVMSLLHYRVVYGDFLVGRLVLNGVVFALTAPVLVTWLRSARRMRRQSAARQWQLAVLAWVVVIAGMLVCLNIVT